MLVTGGLGATLGDNVYPLINLAVIALARRVLDLGILGIAARSVLLLCRGSESE